MADFTFWFIALLTVASAMMVVMSKSLLYSAYSLLVTFLGVTALYVFLWADFQNCVQNDEITHVFCIIMTKSSKKCVQKYEKKHDFVHNYCGK